MDKKAEDRGVEPLLKQGMVWKRGRKITSAWKRRYFVLRPTTLSYHAGMDTENEEKRYIEITQSSTVTHRPDKHPLAFQVRTPGYRKITARCETEEELHSWMTAIEECIREAPAWPIKCVVVGDDEEQTFGKRVMVNRYLDACRGRIEDGEAKMLNPHGYTTLNKSKTRIVKTPDELGNVDLLLEYDNGEWIKLMLWHLDGTESCTKLRTLAYPHSDIYIVVFSVSDAKSFEKVEAYMKEIKTTIRSTVTNGQNPLFLLVGTRLSSELVAVGFNQGEERARTLGFSGYVECRIDSEEDCEQVFRDAVRLVIEKSVMVFASSGGENNPSHARNASGIFSALASRFGMTKRASEQTVSSSVEDTAKDDTSETSPSHRSAKSSSSGKFFSEKIVSVLRHSKKSDLTAQADAIKAAGVRASAADGEEDSDEGSLIGVEIDDADEDSKARLDRDFGLTDMKDDLTYTHKVLSRSNSRRSGEQAFGASHRSLNAEKELPDIQETAAEERERELEELRMRDAKRERELERMKAMMDSLKSHNKAVEDQLKAMREELAVVQQKGGLTVGLKAPMPPLAKSGQSPEGAFQLPPPSIPTSSSQSPVKTFDGLPPRPPPAANSSPARSAFRANRATSVFF